ncbi:chloride channel protein [Lichenicoccus sp.]|uniref:chloride channel protein n=1 Tax=Lichenicoccus sp. TaxID=2781899 RepID=UPI003D112DE7
MISPILARRDAAGFWMAVLLTGIGTGLSAAALTELLELVQHTLWSGNGVDLLDAAARTAAWKHIVILLGAGLLTGAGQLLLVRLSAANSIDITAAIWFHAGRLPALRTLGSAVLSILVVGMGASLGREGAPKQAGAVVANVLSDRVRLSDDQRRLLVACGAGAGMAAAYGVPLGGALFALEVLRGELALRFVLPALLTSLIATGVSWAFLPDAPTYQIPSYAGSAGSVLWALLAGPAIAVVSVGYVRAVAWADRHRPQGPWRLAAPAVALTVLGMVSIAFPQLLGNGRDIAQLAFTNQAAPLLLLALLLLKPAATLLCLGSGTPGGLFTPTLAIGALLGGVLGVPWSHIWPGTAPGLCAVLGAAALLAATTQGPLSAIVLMMELTGHARAFIVPLLLIVAIATLVARTIEPRSIYDARLTDAEVLKRQRERDPPSITRRRRPED